jgi:hypothetical protein
MGFLQDSFWNTIFKYSYPVSFIATLFYLVLSVLKRDVDEIITNKYVLIVVNIFIGLSAIFSCIVWFNTDTSNVNTITSYIDLNVDQIKAKTVKNI